MRRTPLRRSTKPLKRTSLRRSVRIGEAARRRIRGGGVTSQGRVALSVAGLATLRNMILLRSGGRCEACGERRVLELEHALPRGRGGADTWANCWAVCAGPGSCHRKKEGSFQAGRLLVSPCGNGRFLFRLAAGEKHAQVILHEWTGGRVATAAEAARLAELR
jgi:5-methylcytosine-specific restriction endonuclease McrA